MQRAHHSAGLRASQPDKPQIGIADPALQQLWDAVPWRTVIALGGSRSPIVSAVYVPHRSAADADNPDIRDAVVAGVRLARKEGGAFVLLADQRETRDKLKNLAGLVLTETGGTA